MTALGVAPAVVLGQPGGFQSLDRMIRDAKLIVVGAVVEGGQTGTVASVTLVVQRTLKGQPPSGFVSAKIEVSEGFPAIRNLKGWHGMWFVTEDGRLLPAVSGSLILLGSASLPVLATLPSAWASPEAASPTEKVLREVAAAIEANPDVPLLPELVSQIFTAESVPALRNVYRRMLSSPSQVVSAAGVAGLLRSGDVQGLESLPELIARGPLSPGVPSIGQAVCDYFNGNVRGLPILAELATTPPSVPRLRECAASTLRNIHYRESLPYLLALLDADDLNVRYQGAVGLASYANSGFVLHEKRLVVDGVFEPRLKETLRTEATEANFPALETFQRDERSMVSFWRRWAREYIAADAAR